MTREVRFTPTAADYAAAGRANLLWAWRRRRTWRAWIGMIAACAGTGALLDWWIGPGFRPQITLVYAAIGVLLMPVIYLIAYALAGRRVARLVRQQPSAGLAQHWSWDGDGLTIAHAQGRAFHRWSELFGWQAGGVGLVIYLNERSFFSLPARAVNAECLADLRGTAEQAGLRRY